MLKNYFKTAVRSLTKNKLFSFINIFGLAIGLGAFLLIFQFVSFEQSFDNFHDDSERIYRIQFERIYSDKHDKSAGLTAGAGPALKEDFPEIEHFSKLSSADYMNNVVSVGDKRFLQTGLFYADSSFFEIFSYKLIEGDRRTALREINSIVITKEVALSYFGRTDVIGELVKLRNSWEDQVYKVTGVAETPPTNTHLQFQALISFENLVSASGGSAGTSFGWNAFPTYLMLKPGTDYKALEAKFPEFAERRYSGLIDSGVKPVLYLQPLQDIYLTSNLRFEVGPLGNARIVNILIGISIFIITLAYFNYINLSTVKSLERAKEIGVRKVTGANRGDLIRQFLFESFVLNLMGIILGVTIMQVSLPFFESVLNKPIGNSLIFEPNFIAIIAGLLIGGTLLSGAYPAWTLSRMQAIRVLKGQRVKNGFDALVRKGLVVLQFSILCFLLVGSLAVRSQIDYMLTSDRGFDSEQTIVVYGPSSGENSATKLGVFKNELLGMPDVQVISNSTMVPGDEIGWVNNSVRLIDAPENGATSMPFLGIDDNFVSNLSLEIIAGRNFNKEIFSDSLAVLLSREASVNFGFKTPEDALGRAITEGSNNFRIVGVVENYLQKSFKTGYDPIVYRYVPLANTYFNIKVTTNDYERVLAGIESSFLNHYPESPFNYFFLDEFFERQFKEERVFGQIFNLFTILGVWISCLGLFGLTSFAVSQRRKEIGIRKVLGAGVSSVVVLLSKRFIYLILVAFAIALPMSYYATDQWLSNYSFATNLKLYMFAVPVTIVLVITLLTTGTLAVKTANRNPVDSLRQD